jgi:hypothetical protein
MVRRDAVVMAEGLITVAERLWRDQIVLISTAGHDVHKWYPC